MFMKKIANVRSSKICAFCNSWYDPSNSHINPVNTVAGFWEYEHNSKCKCLKTNLDKPAWASCSRFKCKF